MGELLYRGARAPQLPPSLLLLVWAAAIALPWAVLFWLAALFGRLTA